MSKRIIPVLLCLTLLMIYSCSKKKETASLSYGGPIFYITNQSADYIISPLQPSAGSYTSEPQGLVLDPSTGAVNVNKSDAGLKYRITHTDQNGNITVAFIIISGINFPDHYYYLNNGDSVARPVYNSNPDNQLPLAVFDEDKVVSGSGCSIKTNNGQINLQESIRNGLFGNNPQNNTRKDFDLKYRIDDKSGKALNSLKLLIYYFKTLNDVPADLQQTVKDHQDLTFTPTYTPGLPLPARLATVKPRPPCIVIIAH